MATKGKFTATSASTIIVPANKYRDHLIIQKLAGAAIALGIGEAAVLDEGILLTGKDSTVEVDGAAAAKAIYAIGNTGTGTYQEGKVSFSAGSA
jgi:hypothetical protein